MHLGKKSLPQWGGELGSSRGSSQPRGWRSRGAAEERLLWVPIACCHVMGSSLGVGGGHSPVAADVQRPRGGRMTAGLRPQQQPGQLGSFKSRPGRGPAPGRDGWCCQEAGQPGSWPTSPSRSQPIGARRAQDILKTHPCWSGRGAGMCHFLPWHLHSWGLSTGQAFPHQCRSALQKEPEIELYKYQCRR